MQDRRGRLARWEEEDESAAVTWGGGRGQNRMTWGSEVHSSDGPTHRSLP